MRIPTLPAAFGDSLPELVSYSDIPQLDSENCITEDKNPHELHMDNADLLDLGLSAEDIEKIDEYLFIDHLPSFQTLSNIACGFKIPIVNVQKYVEWKQSLETTLTMF